MPRSRKKPGPATKPAKLRKSEVIRMRVTAEQKDIMEAAAAADGLEMSQWLRQLALKAAGALPIKK
jgi:uncharacterized protein (DUF1778 family)